MKRGRPRGVTISAPAIEDLCESAGVSKGALCEVAGITSGHLSDALHRQKGIQAEAVERMAAVLGCRPATIAPELAGGKFVAIRPADRTCDLSVESWLAAVSPLDRVAS